MAVGSAVQIGFAGRGIIMNKFLLSVFSLALLACMTGVLAWQQPGRYHATYYSGQYDSGDSHLYRAEQPYGNRQGVNQPRGIRIEKASDADSYLLRIHTRGMSPDDITLAQSGAASVWRPQHRHGGTGETGSETSVPAHTGVSCARCPCRAMPTRPDWKRGERMTCSKYGYQDGNRRTHQTT
jgi:hypothetical protein